MTGRKYTYSSVFALTIFIIVRGEAMGSSRSDCDRERRRPLASDEWLLPMAKLQEADKNYSEGVIYTFDPETNVENGSSTVQHL